MAHLPVLLELIVAMEEIFGVKFEQADINSETLRSVSTLTQLIREKADQ